MLNAHPQSILVDYGSLMTIKQNLVILMKFSNCAYYKISILPFCIYIYQTTKLFLLILPNTNLFYLLLRVSSSAV